MPSKHVGSPAADDIRAAIDAAGGAIPFSEFQRLALYGPAGFYTLAGGGRAGRRGAAFLTSPEVGPLFGAVLARYLDAQWELLGRPASFTVVDAGAGPGTLARTILAARPECLAATRYVAVELSARQRESHPPGVESRGDLPDGPFDGVIIANELLDDVPFRLCVFDGSWREAFVTATADGTFGEVLSAPFDPLPAALPLEPAHGSRAPLHDAAVGWIADARSRLRRGRLLVVDYARPTTAALAARPWRQWLRTYRGHQRGDHYLADPGSQDITVEIALDQFPEPDAVATQAQFLQRWGIDELVDEGARRWAANAATPDLAAVAMRSRGTEVKALLDPTGLGAFAAVEWSGTVCAG
jgi:SAM-dependent MidA family methyltransferase